jgi:hypothetical protein
MKLIDWVLTVLSDLIFCMIFYCIAVLRDVLRTQCGNAQTGRFCEIVMLVIMKSLKKIDWNNWQSHGEGWTERMRLYVRRAGTVCSDKKKGE